MLWSCLQTDAGREKVHSGMDALSAFPKNYLMNGSEASDVDMSEIPQVGDGTTTVVILAGELLKECKAFVEEGVHPRVTNPCFVTDGRYIGKYSYSSDAWDCPVPSLCWQHCCSNIPLQSL